MYVITFLDSTKVNQWDTLEYTGICIPGYTRIYWDIPGYSRIYWDIPELEHIHTLFIIDIMNNTCQTNNIITLLQSKI